METLTNGEGNTEATYRYNSYGTVDHEGTTGLDAVPEVTADPGEDEAPTEAQDVVNPYRFNSMRMEYATGQYDMGFRDYDPGINRFLTRDSYNGALDDLALGLDPWTTNRYAFAGGNPVVFAELDGHRPIGIDGEEIVEKQPYFVEPTETVGPAQPGAEGGSAKNPGAHVNPVVRDAVMNTLGHMSLAGSVLSFVSARDIGLARHYADSELVRARRMADYKLFGRALRIAGHGLGGAGLFLTFRDELTRETEVQVSTEERVADATITVGAGWAGGMAVVAAVGGGAACAVSVLCGVGVVAVGTGTALVTNSGLHENDGWLTPKRDHDSSPLAPGPEYMPGAPHYSDQFYLNGT